VALVSALRKKRPVVIELRARRKKKIINQMKEKLIANNAMISKADKGNSIVDVIT
jgi:hypothetical protein